MGGESVVDHVLTKLVGVEERPDGGWTATCPAHDPRAGSDARVHIAERSDGSVSLHCPAGCPKSLLLAALGLTFADLFAELIDDAALVRSPLPTLPAGRAARILTPDTFVRTGGPRRGGPTPVLAFVEKKKPPERWLARDVRPSWLVDRWCPRCGGQMRCAVSYVYDTSWKYIWDVCDPCRIVRLSYAGRTELPWEETGPGFSLCGYTDVEPPPEWR